MRSLRCGPYVIMSLTLVCLETKSLHKKQYFEIKLYFVIVRSLQLAFLNLTLPWIHSRQGWFRVKILRTGLILSQRLDLNK